MHGYLFTLCFLQFPTPSTFPSPRQSFVGRHVTLKRVAVPQHIPRAMYYISPLPVQSTILSINLLQCTIVITGMFGSRKVWRIVHDSTKF